MRTAARCTLGVLMISAVAVAHAQKRGPNLDGAWEHVRSHVERPDSARDFAHMEGMAVFHGGYFSQIFVNPAAPGVQQQGFSQPATAEEKVARFDVLTANAGTYETHDSTLTFRYTHAKNPRVEGVSTTATFRLRGDTLWVMRTMPWAKDSTKTVHTTAVFVRMR